MPENSTVLDRLREFIAAGGLVIALGSGWYLVGPETLEGDVIRVAAFNVQVFGQTKAGKPDVMDVLAQVAREFDVVVVQEIRDASESVADHFLDRINEEPGVSYRMYEGPRLGRTSSKEQYVVYYVPARVQLLDAFVQPDPDDVFEREPLVTTLRAGNFDFSLVAAHIKPGDAANELAELAEAATSLLQTNPSEGDVILLGDFNADCRYFEEDDLDHPLRAEGFRWVIDNDVDTMITSDCTYDRIILLDSTFGREYVRGSAEVFYFDEEYALTETAFVRTVSDHYPVYAEFRTSMPDDDG